MESLAQDLNQMVRTPLQDAHVAALRKAGWPRRSAKGDIIAEAGAPMTEFVYIVEGEIEVIDPFTREAYLPHNLGLAQRRTLATST